MTNHVDVWRGRYRGSFSLANWVALLAAALVLAVNYGGQAADVLPQTISTATIAAFAVLAYALTLAVMLWLPARARKKSRLQDETATADANALKDEVRPRSTSAPLW
jgi:hypothetical protein